MYTSPLDTTPPTPIAVIVSAVAAPVKVGEALGAKMVVMSLLLILSDGCSQSYRRREFPIKAEGSECQENPVHPVAVQLIETSEQRVGYGLS